MENYEENWKAYRAKREQFYSLEKEVDNNIEKYENENKQYDILTEDIKKIISFLKKAENSIIEATNNIGKYYSGDKLGDNKNNFNNIKKDINNIKTNLKSTFSSIESQITINNNNIDKEETRRADAYEELKRG